MGHNQGVRGTRAGLIAALAASLLLVVAISYDFSDGGRRIPFLGEHEYVVENMRMLGDVPVYPGSRLQHTNRSSEYRDTEDPLVPPKGWASARTYRAPDGARMRDVLAFYDAALARRGWSATGAYCGHGYYTKGEGLIVVNAGGVNPRDPTSSYDIGVDAHGADECHRD